MSLNKDIAIAMLAANFALAGLAAANGTRQDTHSGTAMTRPIAAYTAATSAVNSRASQTRELILEFYTRNGNQPAWTANRRELMVQVLQQVRSAEQHGLTPGDYPVQTALIEDENPTEENIALFDLQLTGAALRFLSDLHSGRTEPEFKWYAGRREPDDFDPAQLLIAALDQKSFSSAIAAAQPKNPLYARVKQTLANYRMLRQWYDQLAPLPPLHRRGAGGQYAGETEVKQRLVLLGDMMESSNANTEVSDGSSLVAGLKSFQSRHGLNPDGILGTATLAALSVPLSQRIRQLELTLERLRWLPPLPPGPIIVINVPAFRLLALDTRTSPATVELEMRVIVGNAVRTPTPLLIAQLRHVEFNPMWNIPRSIEVQELIPKLARDPELLRKEDLELVPRNGLAISTQPALESLRAGTMRLRQRPGPRNPLGAVKFSMPNPLNIYLHATPTKQLFAKTRRDFSHGCIRLEHPEDLAVFVLRNEEGWDRAAVLAAMEPSPTRTVLLSTPVPVVLIYATALADRKGRAIFLPDAYGLDKKLANAIQVERRRPQGILLDASD